MEERRVCGSFLLCWGVEDNSAIRERKLLPNTEVHERRGWELTNHSPKRGGGGQSLWQCCATCCCPSKGAGQQFLASQSFKLWKSISLWSERKEQRSHTEEELTLAGRNEKFVGAHLYAVGCRNVYVGKLTAEETELRQLSLWSSSECNFFSPVCLFFYLLLSFSGCCLSPYAAVLSLHLTAVCPSIPLGFLVYSSQWVKFTLGFFFFWAISCHPKALGVTAVAGIGGVSCGKPSRK